MTARIALLILVVSLSAGAAAGQGTKTVTTTTFVFTGRGWGHGVGMGQYGALGMAKRGITYDKILAHFYRGTQLTPAGVSRIRVLLVEGWRLVTIASPVPFRVRDGKGVVHDLDPGRYRFGAGLLFKLAGADIAQALPGPLRFLPGKAPLELGRRYRGVLDVTVRGKSLFVDQRRPARGVHPRRRQRRDARGLAARGGEGAGGRGALVRARAAAQRRRSTSTPTRATRSTAARRRETPVGDRASAETKGQVLIYNGKVATTFFFSTSGGRTASVDDVVPRREADAVSRVGARIPYDTLSPYHTWGPVVLRGDRCVEGGSRSPVSPTCVRFRRPVARARSCRRARTVSSPCRRRACVVRSTSLDLVPAGRAHADARRGTTLSGASSGTPTASCSSSVCSTGAWEQGPALEAAARRHVRAGGRTGGDDAVPARCGRGEGRRRARRGFVKRLALVAAAAALLTPVARLRREQLRARRIRSWRASGTCRRSARSISGRSARRSARCSWR